MAFSSSTLFRSLRRRAVVVLSTAVLIWIAVVCRPSSAATPASPAGPSPTAVVLSDQDWQRMPREPITSRKVDDLIAAELRAGSQSFEPAPLTTDEQFIRRVTLDLTGRLPIPDQITEFVSAGETDKRSKLIDSLLQSEAYARHWARFWRDVVTARITNRRSMGLTRSFEEWLYERLRAGASWKEITRSILQAEGELRFTLNTPSAENGALFFLVAHDGEEAEERAAETSRVFLGIQIQCAQCHDHPTENWKRRQFHELAAYFSRIKYEQLFDETKKKTLAGVKLTILSDGEHKMASLTNPEESSLVHPRFVDGRAPAENLSDRERRRALADAVVADENHWFAAAYVNRVWGEVMGRTFYRHVDDLGPNKEVIFPEVLRALTGAFQASDYDVNELFRTILNTEAYQRQLRVDATDSPPFLAASSTRLRADALWDSLVHVFGKIEPGARFHTGGGVRFNSSFLEGKFRAEFDFDPSLDLEEINGTIPQALFLMNNQVLNQHIQATRTSFLGRVLRDFPEDAKAIDRVYLSALARRPTDRELSQCLAHIAASPTRPEAFEDILWALINSTEFQRKR
jgi:hypothetical protein